MARGSRPPRELLRFVAAVEGRPPSTAMAASRLGLKPTELRRRVLELKRRRLIVTQTLLDRRVLCGDVECITRVRVDQSQPGAVRRFEGALREDPSVIRADLVSGRWDYLLRSLHPDERRAGAWLRGLKECPVVRTTEMRFVETVLERPCFAAALLRGLA